LVTTSEHQFGANHYEFQCDEFLFFGDRFTSYKD